MCCVLCIRKVVCLGLSQDRARLNYSNNFCLFFKKIPPSNTIIYYNTPYHHHIRLISCCVRGPCAPSGSFTCCAPGTGPTVDRVVPIWRFSVTKCSDHARHTSLTKTKKGLWGSIFEFSFSLGNYSVR